MDMDYCFPLSIVIAAFYFIGVTEGYSIQTPGNDSLAESLSTHVALCNSYCDLYGYYQPQKYCISQDGSQVYCCGSQNTRYCCTDRDKDVGELYPNVKSCPNSGYWMYQWRIIIGLLGTISLMICFAGCCYFCFGNKQPPASARNQARRRRRRPVETDANGQPVAPVDALPEEFDPESPYAFIPPEYDSLPKDPPKYLDIFNMDGQLNPAFDEETPESSNSDSSRGSDGNHDNESEITCQNVASNDDNPESGDEDDQQPNQNEQETEVAEECASEECTEAQSNTSENVNVSEADQNDLENSPTHSTRSSTSVEVHVESDELSDELSESQSNTEQNGDIHSETPSTSNGADSEVKSSNVVLIKSTQAEQNMRRQKSDLSEVEI